jgi:type IV pilus assembly protein PilB
MNTHGKKSMEELLLEKGVITPSQLAAAKIEQQKTGDSIFRVLPRLGFILQDQMVEFITHNTDISRIELEYLVIDPQVVKLIPEELARKHLVMPVLKIGNTLTCAMVDVFNIYVQDDLASRTGLTIDPAIATENEIKRSIDQFYVLKGDMDGILKNTEGVQSKAAPEAEEINITRSNDVGEAAPVVAFVNSMITKAVSEDASDIHVEPEENSLAIRFRIDGVLHLQSSPPKVSRRFWIISL